MATFADFLAQYRQHVRHLVGCLARRQYLSADEESEFAARVEVALERNDYQILKDFEGRSTWETYLDTVVHRTFFEDFQPELWGDWRPTLSAIRVGPVAILLEELVDRDGLPLDEAIYLMQRTHRVEWTRASIEDLHRRLHEARHASRAAWDSGAVVSAERLAFIDAALQQARSLLPPDDRLVLRLRFDDGYPVPFIAKVLRMGRRAVQHRLDQAKAALVQAALTQGVTADEIDGAVRSAAQGDTESGRKKWWQTLLSRPSKY